MVGGCPSSLVLFSVCDSGFDGGITFSKGQFVDGMGYLLHTLVFGAVVYVFSLITLRIIHNNMFIQSDHYLVRWFGALKMSLRELWQPLLGSYVFTY